MKFTGHVGVYKIKETHLYMGLLMPEGEIIICGITANPRIMGHIWKGWHFDKEEIEHFNNRDSFFNKKYFSSLYRNQIYLDWNKLERVIP